MKSFFILVFMISGVFAQVDSVYTRQKIITGVIVGVNKTEICISHYSYDKLWIPIEQVDRLVSGRNGNIIIGLEAPINGYELFVARFNEDVLKKKKAKTIWMKSY